MIGVSGCFFEDYVLLFVYEDECLRIEDMQLVFIGLWYIEGRNATDKRREIDECGFEDGFLVLLFVDDDSDWRIDDVV